MGWRYEAEDITEQIHGTAKTVKVLELPELGKRKDKYSKDFSDWADIDDNGKQKLIEIISEVSEWTPPGVLDEKLAIVEELNQEHLVTRIGGKTIVVNEVHDPAMDRNILTYSTPTDLKKLLSKQVHQGEWCPSLNWKTLVQSSFEEAVSWNNFYAGRSITVYGELQSLERL